MSTLTNNTLTRQVDLPTWEWTRFAPANSSAISCTCSADNSNIHPEEHGRYIYSLISATQFFRYDTWADMYQQLANPPIAPVTFSSMKYCGGLGIDGRVIAAGASTLTIPSITQQALLGYDVVIVSGTGAGQRRTITGVAEPVIADSGTVTAVSNVQGDLFITDSLKSWIMNQWRGYSVRVRLNTGVSQIRRIINHTTNEIVFSDPGAYLAFDNFANPAIFSPAISATAGSQTNYTIESQVITVDSPWTVQPDTTSVFRIQSGLILLTSNNTSAPFFTMQAYDIITDSWYILPAMQNIFSAQGNDISIDRTSENASIWEKGIATGGSTTTLIDASHGVDLPSWKIDQWKDYWVYIYSGTGAGQIRQIASNTANTLTWVTAGTAPTSTSRYMIIGFDAGTATSGTASTITDSTKAWAVNRWSNYAVRILAGTGAGQVRPIASNTATALIVVRPWITTPDNTSVYAIQGDPDKLYIQLGGISGMAIYNLDSLVPTFGRQGDFGGSRPAVATVGNVSISVSAGNTGTSVNLFTQFDHPFKSGDLVTIRGFSDPNINVTNAPISVTQQHFFTITAAATPSNTNIANPGTSNTLVDSSKNWNINQWAGFMAYIYGGSITGTNGSVAGQALRIISNTANTLTFATNHAGLSHNLKYSISTTSAIGAIESGVATGTQSSTSLQDTTKSWATNIWAGKRLRILTSTGFSTEVNITSNTSNTLTIPTITAPTTLVTGYVILEQSLKGAGVNLNWAFGTSDANLRGRYLFSTRGGAVIGFDRFDLTTDRCNQIFSSPNTETLSTGTMTAYDGADNIFYHKDATQRVMSLNVITGKVNGGSMYPYAAPTATLGNRMEIFTTKDGLKYLWLNRSSFQECFRCLIFWT
jgi:hypothetical protein